MEYSWNKKELLHIRKTLTRHGSHKADVSNIDEMLEILTDDLDLSAVNITPLGKEFSYHDALEDFLDGLDNYPEHFLNTLMSFFRIEDDLDSFLWATNITQYELSDKDMLDMGRECLGELNNKELLEYYNHLCQKEYHLLHISNDKDFYGASYKLYGSTYFIRANLKSYIAVFKEGSLIDFQTLIHEVMHAYFYKILGRKRVNAPYFRELDGRYGNALALEFLRNHGLSKYAEEMEEYDNNCVLNDSYNLYLNDLLYITSSKGKFNLNKAKEMYEADLGIRWDYTPSDIRDICSIHGGYTASDIFDYLVIVDLMGKGYTMKDIFKKVKYLKENDFEEILEKLHELDITFPRDGFTHARFLNEKIKGRTN